jgi:hypothetical protein
MKRNRRLYGHAPEPGLHLLEDRFDDGGTWARYGAAMHRSYGQLLQQRLGYKLSFHDVWPLLKDPSAAPCSHDPSTTRQAAEEVRAMMDMRASSNHLNCSYGGIDTYHGTTDVGPLLCLGGVCGDFAFCFVSAADEYMLLDPLQCSSNADRIIRVWEPLVKQFQQAAGSLEVKRGSSKREDHVGSSSKGTVASSKENVKDEARARGGKPGAKGGEQCSSTGRALQGQSAAGWQETECSLPRTGESWVQHGHAAFACHL